MAIKLGEYLNTKNIYIDYPFEEVMFRRMKSDGSIFRKLYSRDEESAPIHHHNRLYNNALLSGYEISEDEYLKGK